MVRKFTSFMTLFAAAIAVAATAPPAQAQSGFPNKPIRLIVPQAPGSATDTIARLVAAEMGPVLKQQIVIENRPGAAFTIGLDIVAKAQPDGYTIAIGPVGALAISPNMVPKLPYSILNDFQPIAMISRGHLLLAVAPESDVKSVKELIDKGKKNPGKLTNASSANGSPGHVGGELFKTMAGIEAVHVPYRGGAAALNDLIAGRVDFMFESLNSISPHAKSGKVRALAVSGDRRSPAFPDLPTVAQAGVAGYSAPTWSGIVGPAKLPPDVLKTLNEAVNKAVSTQAFKERFGAIGDEPAGGTPEEFANVIRVELAKWAEVVKRSGAKMQQ
ncbi:MAG: tripartite tricarboxylate transporter substrate binding protein [Alphaproteobacteria bacterium]|nr:tripartite tricarboxylate transporter substrate binding protein [Alphaproteobacteria bacterium]